MAKTVYAIMNDTDFENRIRESARKLNADFFTIKSNKNFAETIQLSIPKIVIVDLLSVDIDVENIINQINDTRRLKYVSLIGVVPDSVETNQISKFLTGRCNLVFTKTKFQRNIDHLIKRNL